MDWIVHQLRVHPELAIFLTLFVGFWIGKIKIGKFSLGVVTSVLLVGVLVGQLDITVDGPIKSVFFLLFLFAIGYKVGPQFFRGLKKDGLPQMGFAAIMCVFCLIIPWILAKIMGYNVGEAAGLLAGSQTISAVIGVAGDTINELNISPETKEAYNNIIPVSYAVTYIFGTAGSAWVLGSLGPRLLGGLDKVKAACKELEAKMGNNEADQPGFMAAARPVTFRAYKIANDWFGDGKRVSDLESYFQENDKRLFVERVRQAGVIVKEVSPTFVLKKGDEVVLSGRREYVIGEEDWIGPEVLDPQLLDFPAEVLPVMVTRKTVAGEKVSTIRALKFMHGVSIRRIKRAGIDIPVLAQTVVDAGDMVELVGTKHEVDAAAGICRPADQPDRHDLCRTGHFDRRTDRRTQHSHGRSPHQPQHQRRSLDRRIILRMATQQTPYFRTYSRTRSLDTGQRGTEHVYCRCGHCCRSQLRARVQGSGFKPVHRRRTGHFHSSDSRHTDGKIYL